METAWQLPQGIEVDEDGLMIRPEMWNEDVAREFARQLGIGALNDDHWKIIGALREYFKKYGVAPAMNKLCHDQDMDRHSVHDLFMTCLNAWRVAGLPNPGEEAKSYLSDM